jgi:hypothetical protein
MIGCCLSRAMCPCARPFKTNETALRDTPTRSATSCAVALRTTLPFSLPHYWKHSMQAHPNDSCSGTEQAFSESPRAGAHAGDSPSAARSQPSSGAILRIGLRGPRGRSSVRPLASRVEWCSVKDEQAVGDLAVLDGDAFGTGSALDRHCFGVVHDHCLLVVTKGGNEL